MDRTYHGAQVLRVIDGDTVELAVNCGFNVWVHAQAFRLVGCNAIEHDQPGGVEATANLSQLLPVGSVVSLTSIRPDKFGGRYDAVITLPDGRDLVQVLLASGWVAPWKGRGPKPVPVWPRTAPNGSAG